MSVESVLEQYRMDCDRRRSLLARLRNDGSDLCAEAAKEIFVLRKQLFFAKEEAVRVCGGISHHTMDDDGNMTVRHEPFFSKPEPR